MRFRRTAIMAGVAASVATIGGVGIGLAGGIPKAAAYDCPTGRVCHFLRVSTNGLPIWEASAQLTNTKTGEVYHQWKESHGWSFKGNSGGYALWYWNMDPSEVDNTSITLRLLSTTIDTNVKKTYGPASAGRDWCYSIDDIGNQMGPANECTPD